MKLNLGCGKRNMAEFINIDAVKQTEETVVGDILDLEYPDNSVEEIFSEHVIEHLDKNEIVKFFSEIYRLLMPGGKIVLISPDMITAVEEYLIGIITIDVLDNRLFALHKHPHDYHKQGIYADKLKRLCTGCGLIIDSIYTQDRSHSIGEIVLEAHKAKQGGRN